MKKLTFIIAALLVAATAAAVGIVTYLQLTRKPTGDGTITLDSETSTERTLSYSANGLIPGDEREYSVNIKVPAGGKYTLSLDFEETRDRGLKEFINVDLDWEGATYSATLSALLASEPVIFSVDIGGAKTTVLKIKYSMPSSVGNEAKNATCDFDIKLKADSANNGQNGQED